VQVWDVVLMVSHSRAQLATNECRHTDDDLGDVKSRAQEEQCSTFESRGTTLAFYLFIVLLEYASAAREEADLFARSSYDPDRMQPCISSQIDLWPIRGASGSRAKALNPMNSWCK
jgi:hypothetical protein